MYHLDLKFSQNDCLVKVWMGAALTSPHSFLRNFWVELCYNYYSSGGVKLKTKRLQWYQFGKHAIAGGTMDSWTQYLRNLRREHTHTLQNNSFEGNNFECNSHGTTVNTGLESCDRDQNVDVSTLEIN